MRLRWKESFFLGLWAVLAVLAGSVLMSYHAPFREPSAKILALAGGTPAGKPQWRAIHILSGSCGCSQRVMRHLLERRPFPAIHEEVLLVDGPESYLPGSKTLAAKLGDDGFKVRRIPLANIPEESGLRGVPLLVFASPQDEVVYLGGYGSAGDKDGAILDQIRLHRVPKSLPILGCAIGSRLRRRADPFHWKY